jgi:hypothetical protein
MDGECGTGASAERERVRNGGKGPVGGQAAAREIWLTIERLMSMPSI